MSWHMAAPRTCYRGETGAHQELLLINDDIIDDTPIPPTPPDNAIEVSEHDI